MLTKVYIGPKNINILKAFETYFQVALEKHKSTLPPHKELTRGLLPSARTRWLTSPIG